ncbi:MAG TPA: serine/threonine-protein kinase [Candidatus Polarisedimenticolaceae bacterium]|nr:serine/threonine-protein kinase [Candidatus Polarisedimenticolaceae bacterium]
MIESGSLVGSYRIDGEIGRGGTAHVYRATDANGRAVALKAPRNELSDPGTIRRFLKEVRLTARLVHPNIVAVLGGFEHAGLPWLVLQFVEGESLGAMIDAGGPLPLAEVVRHGQGLASALAFAHTRGVLHQDVSPNNILIAEGGQAMLSDFGLASLASSAPSSLVSTRPVVGTAGYMAPEKILGHVSDGRSDVFSLGAVLYEMATGRPAFAGSTNDDLLDATLEMEPPAMGGPAELERIVTKALAKSPDDRYQSAAELEGDLHRNFGWDPP